MAASWNLLSASTWFATKCQSGHWPSESMPALSRVDTSTFSGKLLNFLGFRDQSENEEAPDYDELDGLEAMNNGTSTRFYNHVHWSSYTALIFAGLFAVILFVGATLRWSGCGGGGRRRGRRRGGKSGIISATKTTVHLKTWRAAGSGRFVPGLPTSSPPVSTTLNIDGCQ